jgi:hypothetical protein
VFQKQNSYLNSATFRIGIGVKRTPSVSGTISATPLLSNGGMKKAQWSVSLNDKTKSNAAWRLILKQNNLYGKNSPTPKQSATVLH